jgi:hypothetical protein
MIRLVRNASQNKTAQPVTLIQLIKIVYNVEVNVKNVMLQMLPNAKNVSKDMSWMIIKHVLLQILIIVQILLSKLQMVHVKNVQLNVKSVPLLLLAICAIHSIVGTIIM